MNHEIDRDFQLVFLGWFYLPIPRHGAKVTRHASQVATLSPGLMYTQSLSMPFEYRNRMYLHKLVKRHTSHVTRHTPSHIFAA